MAAYSSTPLAKKLGIVEGAVIRLVGQPANYPSLFADWPEGVCVETTDVKKKDLIHFFTRSAEELQQQLQALKNEIRPNGAIWVSWPKKVAKVPTDLTEDVIRQLALAAGLVDVKVCSVDDVWSGLKLVIPVKDRAITKR